MILPRLSESVVLGPKHWFLPTIWSPNFWGDMGLVTGRHPPTKTGTNIIFSTVVGGAWYKTSFKKQIKHHQITGWKSSSQISSKLQRWVSMEAIEIMRMLTTAKAPATRRHPSWYRIPTSALCTDMDNTPAPIAALLKQRPVGRTPPRRKMEELFSTILLDMSESPTSLSPPHVVLAVSRSIVLFFTSTMRSMESQAKLESWDASNWVGAELCSCDLAFCFAKHFWTADLELVVFPKFLVVQEIMVEAMIDKNTAWETTNVFILPGQNSLYSGWSSQSY